MSSDPLREVLQKVVQERKDKLQALLAAQAAAADDGRKAELAREIEETEAELKVSQQALQQSPAMTGKTESDGLVLETPGSTESKAGPSRAALEAQIRELQSQLLDQARTVQLARPAPDPRDVAALELTRTKLAAAMQAIAAAEMPAFTGELPPKPTPSQQSEADTLIRQSRVAKMRGQNQVATELLRKAAEVAPGAVSVMEALGDDMMERGLAQPAVDTYAKALTLSNGDPGIERKYAAAIARSKGGLTFEEALQLKAESSLFDTSEAASNRSAAIISFFLPGVGQIVLGQYGRGIAFLIAWLFFIFFAFNVFNRLKPGDSIGPMVIVPLVAALAIQVGAAWACKKDDSEKLSGNLRKGQVERPKPPVDLPFE